MRKEEFLNKLEEALERLSEEDRKKVLRKYKATFTRKTKSGKTDKEIIEEFGNFNELANKILVEHGLETSVQESAHTITDFFKEFLKVVEDIVDYITKKDILDVVKFVLKVLVALLLISILKIPVLLIRDLGKGIFDLLMEPLSTLLIFTWGFIIEILYVIVAITVFVKIFNSIILPKGKK